MSFSQFNLDAALLKQIQVQGYIEPTPIQQQAIPIITEGYDLMGLAQTGTGKTAAFALPILQQLMHGDRGKIRALVIAPTRELAEQIHETFMILGKQTGLRSMTAYGGVSAHNQIKALGKGVDILVACPGRLLDHMQQGYVILKDLEILVLDEADHMFDMGFLPTLRRILRELPLRRQTLLFSATMPKNIRRLADEILYKPKYVEINHTNPVETIEHFLFSVESHVKTSLLEELLKKPEARSVLIFTRTKHRARSLGEKLQKLGHKATSLQGNLSQNRRQEALDGFKSGQYKIMVATDIAARGIDVSRISHVINYDIPDTAEAYTHRIGRTGRAMRSGEAITFVTKDERPVLYSIERNVNAELKNGVIDGFNFDIPKPLHQNEFSRPPRPPMNRRTAATKPAFKR